MKSPLLIFATLLVLFLFGVVATPFFIDWSQYRAEIEDYGRRIMGRDVRIAGDIDIHFLPLPTLSLEDVRVANADTAASPVFVAVKKIEARLLLAPMLRGQVKVHSVVLEKSVFDIERLASGKGNWHLEPSKALQRAVPVEDFALEEIRILDGTLYVRDHRRGGKARFDRVNMSISAASLNGPFKASGALAYNNEPVKLTASTGKLRKNGSIRLSVRLKPQSGARLLYSFDGTILGSTDTAFAEGKIKVAPSPISEDGKTGRLNGIERLPFNLSAQVRLAEEKISLSKIDLSLDKSNAVTNAVTGSMDLKLGFDIGIDANLSARSVDLDALARDLGGDVSSQLSSAVSLDTMDALGALLPDGMRGRVVLSAGQLKTSGAVIESGKLHIRVTDTGVKISELSGVLPGRTRMNLSGLYLPDAVTPQFNGKFSLNALDGRGFLNWMRPGLYGEEAGRIGRLKLDGVLSATPKIARIIDANFSFDGGSGAGTISWSRSGAPFISVKVKSDALDLTTIMPEGKKAGLLDASGLIDQLNTGTAPLSLDMRSDLLTFGGRSLKNFIADVKFSAANTDVRRLAATIGEEGQIDLAGAIVGTGQSLKGEMSGKVNSPDAIGLLEVLGAGDLPLCATKVLEGEPLDVWVEYVSNHELSRLSLEGLAAGGLTGVVLEVKGALGQWRKKQLTLDGEFETNRAGRLLTALDVGPGNQAVAGKNNAKISVSLKGDLPTGLAISIEGRFFDANYKVSGTISDPGNGVRVKGLGSLEAANVFFLSRALGLGTELDGALSLSGRVEGSASRYGIDGLQIVLPGLNGTFDGALTPVKEQFHLIGAARFKQLDFGSVFGLLTLGPPQQQVADTSFWAKRPFRSDALQNLSADVTVNADELVLAPGAKATKASFVLKAGDKTITLTSANGDLLDGTISGNLALKNEAGGNLDVQVRLDARGVDLSGILKGGENKSLAGGKISLSGSVSGRGRSPGGLISVLSGQGEWALRDAVLSGTDPMKFGRSLAEVENPVKLEGLILDQLHKGSWPFGDVQSQWSMESGLLRLAPARLVTGNATGTFGALTNLASGELDASWEVGVAGVEDAPTYSVKLKGPLSDLSQIHDTSGLRSFLAVRVLQENMKKLEELQQEQERLYQEEQAAKKQNQVKQDTEKAAEQAATERLAAEELAKKEATAKEKAAKEAERKRQEAVAKQEAARKEAEIQASEVAALKAALRAAEEKAARLAAEKRTRVQAERKAREEAIQREVEQRVAEELARKETEGRAQAEQEAARKEAEIQASEVAALKAALRAAEEKAARLAAEKRTRVQAERKAREEAIQREVEQRVAEELARKETEGRAQAEQEAARKEAEIQASEAAALKAALRAAEEKAARLAAEKRTRVQAERKAREEAIQREVEQRVAEELARKETGGRAQAEQEAARKEAEIQASEAAALKAALRAAEEKAARLAAEKRTRVQAERKAREEAIQREVEQRVAEELARKETGGRAQAEQEAAQKEAEIQASEVAALKAALRAAEEKAARLAAEKRTRVQAERKAREEAIQREVEQRVAEELARKEAEGRAQAEQERLEAEEERIRREEAERLAREKAAAEQEAAQTARTNRTRNRRKRAQPRDVNR